MIELSERAFAEPDDRAARLILLTADRCKDWLAAQEPALRDWIGSTGFSGEEGSWLRLAGPDPVFLVGLGDAAARWSLAGLPYALPPGDYRIDEACLASLETDMVEAILLGWAMGAYEFNRYRPARRLPARLCWPDRTDRTKIEHQVRAVALVRDLVTTPPNDMGPDDLAAAARAIAAEHEADYRCLTGPELLDANFPLIHLVGRASARAPRLIELLWGEPTAPRVALVGKGVCFDSGGLDLKQPGPMTLMKKDMAGAAHVLALAQLIMAQRLPVRLHVLVAAVENSVAGDAMRPLDVVTARNGTRVEIGNTDAEGRLILADALSAAADERPDILIDFATLTGAATIALGEEVAALFSNCDALAGDLLAAGERVGDPLWRLPLWAPYARKLESRVAELCSIDLAPTPAAGAILGGLFLRHFVPEHTHWAHIDIFAWNSEARPGRPIGGEAQGLLAAYAMLLSRFGAAGVAAR